MKSVGVDKPVYRVERQHVSRGESWSKHLNDSAELLWVEQGDGVHYVNGQKVALFPGILVMLRPGDRHACEATSRDGLTLFSVLFPVSTVEYLRKRYYSDAKNFWSGTKTVPTHHNVTMLTVKRLAMLVQALASRPKEWFFLEHFLMDVIYSLRVMPYGPDLRRAPEWFTSACERIRSPEHFVKGPNGLAVLSGRCLAHVARVSKTLLGKTPADIVNDARMDYAAIQLSLTNKQILEICYDCGFTSLSHFYQLFKSRFKMSPREYRLNER